MTQDYTHSSMFFSISSPRNVPVGWELFEHCWEKILWRGWSSEIQIESPESCSSSSMAMTLPLWFQSLTQLFSLVLDNFSCFHSFLFFPEDQHFSVMSGGVFADTQAKSEASLKSVPSTCQLYNLLQMKVEDFFFIWIIVIFTRLS